LKLIFSGYNGFCWYLIKVPTPKWRVGGTFSTGCTCGYYLATLVTTFHIQPLRGWRVGGTFSTGCTCGYYLATLVTTFHIQPLRGWRVGGHIFHRLHLWLLSRYARYYVSHSTPTGLALW